MGPQVNIVERCANVGLGTAIAMTFDLDRFLPYFRRIGYGIIVLLLFDYAFILIPPQFTNPTWEIQTIGRMVELVWAPVIAFLLIFFPKASPREFNFRFWAINNIMSQFALGLAILHFLMAPLLVVDTLRIHRGNAAQFKGTLLQINNQEQEIENLSRPELENIIADLRAQTGSEDIDTTPNQLKSELLESFRTDSATFKQQVEQNYKTQTFNLVKQTTKWFLGTLVACTLLFNIWRLSREARQSWIDLLELMGEM